MAVALTHLSWWLWGGKDNEPTAAPNGSQLGSSFDFGLGFREPETVKFPSARGQRMRPSSSRRTKRKWQSREERRVDKEYDLVLVPSDGGCLSGSESDDSDWSIGWLEPHAPDFLSESEAETSFAVLVPCYGRGRGGGGGERAESSKSGILGAIDFSDGYSSHEGKKLEELLSALQNS